MIKHLRKKDLGFFFPLGTGPGSAALGKVHLFIAQIYWQVGRRHPDLCILSTIFIFLKFNGEKTNGILWKLLKKLREDMAESSL